MSSFYTYERIVVTNHSTFQSKILKNIRIFDLMKNMPDKKYNVNSDKESFDSCVNI